MYIFQSIPHIISKTYGQYKTVGEKIGSGAFGEIYLATNSNGDQFALKIEPTSCQHPQLYLQYKALSILNDDENFEDNAIVNVYDYFSQQKANILVLQLLGDSLQSLFEKYEKKFPSQTILNIGLQILDRIQYIHSKGFLHRDIKPQNFLIGKGEEENTIYMIDFGLAKKYINKYGSHIAYKDNKSLIGTARYASVNTQLGIQQGCRDDLQGLLYMLIYFFKGKLPWQDVNAKDKKEKYEKILQKKIQVSPEQLCNNIPPQILSSLKYVRKLYFDQQPDYGYLREQLLSALSHLKSGIRNHFCWGSYKI